MHRVVGKATAATGDSRVLDGGTHAEQAWMAMIVPELY